jgi:flagellar hook-associated protein 1 FlgK
MTGIGSVLDIGRWALSSAQTALETTGNNVANVDTPGYSRRSVRLEEGPSIDKVPGQMGTGVRAKEVIRHFDNFVEKQYLSKLSDQERWSALEENLKSVETLFNNAEGSGLNQALAEFWENWQELANRPDDGGVRSALLGKTQTLLNTIQITETDMDRLQGQMDDFIQQDVKEANELLQEIAEINRQIKERGIPGKNNPNQLLDKRNSLLRDLSQIMDIEVHERGQWDMLVTTRAGQTLVDGREHYRLAFESAQASTSLSPDSEFDGEIKFSGSSSKEYLLQVHEPGEVGSADVDDRAKLKISLDGGRTWLKDEEGELRTIEAGDEDNPQSLPEARDLQVWFEEANNELTKGDQFQVVPKSALYWYQTTSSKENITPRKQANGEDDPRRLSGGSLSGEFGFRDDYIGRYREKLDEFSQVLAWELNRLHSQGAGLQKFTEVLGTQKVQSTDQALDQAGSGLDFANRLQPGNLEIYVYNRETGQLEAEQPQRLDMDPGQDGRQNFDPGQHSLQDVQQALNNLEHINAEILNGQLQISANQGYELAFGTDSSGLWAGLGINTFFQGANAQDLALNSRIANNQDFINAARVNGAGEVNPGDNHTALDIAGLQSQKVSFETLQEGQTSQTLQEYFNSLSADVGSDTSQAEYNQEYFQALADDLKSRQDSKSGVNLDEEMANLIKHQQAYTAAAKLITTAEQMMNTLMQMKQ